MNLGTVSIVGTLKVMCSHEEADNRKPIHLGAFRVVEQVTPEGEVSTTVQHVRGGEVFSRPDGFTWNSECRVCRRKRKMRDTTVKGLLVRLGRKSGGVVNLPRSWEPKAPSSPEEWQALFTAPPETGASR